MQRVLCEGSYYDTKRDSVVLSLDIIRELHVSVPLPCISDLVIYVT